MSALATIEVGLREDLLTRLTPRQREVVALYASGLTRPAIARRLGIRPDTVGAHVEAARGLLGAATVTALVALVVSSSSPLGCADCQITEVSIEAGGATCVTFFACREHAAFLRRFLTGGAR